MSTRRFPSLDPDDIQLMTELESDATQIYKDLADKLGMSRPTVASKVRKLLDSDVIKIICWADPVALGYKQAIVRAKDNSTEIVGRGGAPARCFRTESLTVESSNSQTPYSAGQVAGLIRDIPTVAEFINSLVKMSTLISNQVTESLSQISQ